MKALRLPELALLAPQVTGFFEDFHGFLTADDTSHWGVLTDVDGTVLINDAVNGTVDLRSAVASVGDNEETSIAREGECFLFADDKPFYFEAMVKYSEVSTNTNNLFIGLMDAVAQGTTLVDNGGGVRVAGNHVGFSKLDGALNWRVELRDDADADLISKELDATNSLTTTAKVGASSTFQRLGIEFAPVTSTKANVLWSIDGIPVYKDTDFTYGSSTEMQVVVAAMNGNTTLNTITIDYLQCWQLRTI